MVASLAHANSEMDPDKAFWKRGWYDQQGSVLSSVRYVCLCMVDMTHRQISVEVKSDLRGT